MSTITEAVEHVLATREVAEKVAAAREEQREACVRNVEALIERRWPDAGDRPSSPPAAVLDALTCVAAAVLDATPLADTIKELRADLKSAARVTEQLTAERDAARNQLMEAETTPYSEWAATLAAARENVAGTAALLAESKAELDAVRDQAAEVLDSAAAAYVDLKARVLAFAENKMHRGWHGELAALFDLSTTEKPSGASMPQPPSGT